MVTTLGDVYTNNRLWLYPFSCGFEPKLNTLNSCSLPEVRVSEIFVITQRPSSFNNYHFQIELVPRLAPFLTFLRKHPQVWVHTRRESLFIMPFIMRVFKLSNPLIYGDVQADMIYIPHGGGCLNSHLASIQMTSTVFHSYIVNKVEFEHTKPTVILIKRSKRSLRNHYEVRYLIEKYTRHKNIDLIGSQD